ncbi:MAG: transcriptional repressor NrdR [Chloroflexi bacterium]|nr:transcriptional repressor NrdR [Chloroflexota bacterium]
MKCPYCGADESRVIDTREVGDGIRRRRECQACIQRYTTYESVVKVTLQVIKRDGRREDFDRNKLFEGIWRACTKRPIGAEVVENFVKEIENRLYSLGQAEVESRTIGEMVMEGLSRLDPVAYVRFASVYRSFTDLESLKREVDEMIERRTDAPEP